MERTPPEFQRLPHFGPIRAYERIGTHHTVKCGALVTTGLNSSRILFIL